MWVTQISNLYYLHAGRKCECCNRNATFHGSYLPKPTSTSAIPSENDVLTRQNTTQSTTLYSTLKANVNDNRRKALPFYKFRYPLNVDIRRLIKRYMDKGYSEISPINPYRYKYLSLASDKCQSNSSIYLLFLVKSAAANFQYRMDIRNTWGNESLWSSFGARTVFVLGKHKLATVQSKIDKEIELFHDVIQIDFIDNYYNNTFKTIGGYQWILHFCNNSKFVLAVDDDYFVAPERIVKFLSNLTSSESEGLYFGHIGNPYPPRDRSDRWYIPIKDYPYDLYPPFLSGGAILMSRRVAMEISIGFLYTKYFKYDDVYLGIVLFKLGRKPRGNRYMMVRRVNTRVHHEVSNVLAAHNYKGNLRARWKEHLIFSKHHNKNN